MNCSHHVVIAATEVRFVLDSKIVRNLRSPQDDVLHLCC